MPKSLGQIHTVDFAFIGPFANGDRLLCDTSRELSDVLQHNVRWGSIFKTVGIDMQVTEFGAQPGGVSVSGELRYYAPTKGRVRACREGFQAVKRGMKLQGINIRGNRQYDFRAPLTSTALYADIQPGGSYATQATIDGTNGLALYNPAPSDLSIFDVYNSNIEPSQGSTTPSFSSGFGLPGSSDSEDFVLNPGELYEAGMSSAASTELEVIPFQLTYDPALGAGATVAPTFMWRPDPALYLAVLTGQFEIFIDEITYSNATECKIDISIHVAGWKNILGSGRKRGSKKNHSSKKKNGGGKK